MTKIPDGVANSLFELIPDLKSLKMVSQGKVRNNFELPGHPDKLLIVVSDRISIFDFVLPALVKGKGEVLNAINIYWRLRFKGKDNFKDDLVAFGQDIDFWLPNNLQNNSDLQKRGVVVFKLDMLPIEAVVRGCLTGSGYESYLETGQVCGNILPPELRNGSLLEKPIFTPTTKAESGHDLPMNISQIKALPYGQDMIDLAIKLFTKASKIALRKDIILADTKLEFALNSDNQLVVCDEIFTPDSSRFWEKEVYLSAMDEKKLPPPLDKEFVRKWGKELECPLNNLDTEDAGNINYVHPLTVPRQVLEKTAELYHDDIFKMLASVELEEFQTVTMGIK